MKSYYGTLLGKHDRSFRIRHENSPEVPPSGGFTMTSYLACNKTALSRKPCITDKKVIMDRYQEVMFALSECVMNNRLKHSQADKSP